MIMINTFCSAYDIRLQDGSTGNDFADFRGLVECTSSSQGGGGNATTTTAQPTSSSPVTGTTNTNTNTNTTTNTTQDSDGDRDGIPDSSDKCTHNSNPRCFKEGETSTTTAQSSSTTSMARNQTR